MPPTWKEKAMSFPFFDTLFPDSGNGRDLGYVVLALYPEGIFTPGQGPTQLEWFAWPSQREQLVAYCLHNSECDIYTSPCLFKARGKEARRADNISHQWVAYADTDSLDLNKLKAEPTMVVETSPSRHHAYWVTSTDNPGRLVEVSRAIAHTHADDGCDKGGWDAGQLLRVPGSTNNKYRNFDGSSFEVSIKRHGEPWNLKKLEEIYPAVVAQVSADADDMPDRSEWHNTPAVLKEVKEIFAYSVEIEEMFHSKLSPGQDRSESMWNFLGKIVRYGATKKTAMYLGWEAPFCKARLDGRGEEMLWNEVCRAFADPANRAVTNSLQASERARLDESELNPETRARKLASSVTLLHPGERDLVPADTLLDQYVEWAQTCTDAPEAYHRLGGLCLLTSIFGEFGRCPVRRDANLTLWFMMLGPTTRARKTTSMTLWVDILADMQDSQYNYLLGSDVTGEALNVVLPKKDGRTSVFYRDEAHGLFSEQDKKHYFTGLRERMTDLYSGRVPVVLRAATAGIDLPEEERGKAIKARTNFVMFLAGTTAQVTKVLTVDDYQSGHLARFLIAEADPPPMTKEMMYSEQYDGSEDAFDGLRHTLMNRLNEARDFWEARTPPGALKLIPFEKEAWHRLQDAQWDIYHAASRHEMHEMMEATAKRMGDSLMKACVLLAMSEGREKVEMRHLYKAMDLAEEWYANAVTVAGRIMHSSWSARQEEILTMIRGRMDGVTQAEIYARFRHKMQERELDSDLSTLTKANMIKRIPQQGRVRYIAMKRR
jgi:hypothetical protein